MKKKFWVGLENLGLKKDDTLLIHTSFKSLDISSIDANEVLKYLVEYFCKGTLIFPGLSHKYVTELNPCFNQQKTKSCVGILPELFRLNFETVRSMHPTHSVCAIGKDAISITENHKLDNTPCGVNSPFSLLPKYDGKILMLGCGLKPNTSIHAIEELHVPSYLFGKKINYTLVDYQRNCYDKTYLNHNFSGVSQRYDRILDSNLDNWIKKGKILGADCFLMNSKRLWKEANKMLAQDKNIFIEDI